MAKVPAKYKLAVKIVISTCLMVFLIKKISIPELLRLVSDIDLRIIAAALGCFFVSNLLGSFQWHMLLESSGIKLSFNQTFRFYFVGLFFNNFLPANVGGDAVKIYDVTKVGSGVYQVVAVTMLDRLLGVFSLCLLAVFATLYLISSQGPNMYGAYLLVFCACMVPALGFYFFKPLGNLLRKTVMVIRPLSLDTRISSILDHLGKFKGKKLFVSRLVGLSLVIQTLRVLTHVLVGLALGVITLGVTLDFVVLCQFFIFVPLLSLAMIPPITINGIGIREMLGIVLFANAGLAEADAFAMEFLTYVISVAVSLVGFLFFLSRRDKKNGRNGRV
jgi:uncharacterized protein (TIRG00374 family)